ncbi:MAG TPA: type III pantothenate kinase [Gammaproteobacteria bacterium]|nr:type III pantothenate kinase [Gammaproteobacteria bacterium]
MTDLLLADLGNTRLRWADPDALQAGEVAAASHGGALDPALLEECWGGRAAPARLVVANVAGAGAARTVAAWARARWGMEAEFPRSPTMACGVRNGYDRPGQLGVDRFAALVGAYRQGLAPACVVDCGSAITVDLLAADGVHLGGYIAPGLAGMTAALQQSAPELPRAADGVGTAPGRETGAAIAAGIRLAGAGLVERALAQSVARLGPTPACVITGGDGPRLAADLSGASHQAPHLVLQGLLALSQEEGHGTDR